MKIWVKNNWFKVGILIVLCQFYVSYSYADTCIPPTPPVCYNTVPAYTSTGLQSNGSILLPNGGVISSTDSYNSGGQTKQVVVNCAGTRQEVDYEVQQMEYNTCLVVNQSNNRSSHDPYESLGIPPPQAVDTTEYDTADACMKKGDLYNYNFVTHTCEDPEVAKKSICIEVDGYYSHYDSSSDQCSCNDGYNLGYDIHKEIKCIPVVIPISDTNSSSEPEPIVPVTVIKSPVVIKPPIKAIKSVVAIITSTTSYAVASTSVPTRPVIVNQTETPKTFWGSIIYFINKFKFW